MPKILILTFGKKWVFDGSKFRLLSDISQMGFSEKKKRAFSVLRWTMRVVIATCLIFCGYWIITFSGLYREVVLFLSDESGSYGLISSILITLIIVFLPIAVLDYFLLYWLDKIYKKK